MAKGNTGKIMTVAIEAVIFTGLIGTIINSAYTASQNENASSATVVILGLIALIVTAGFIVLIGKQFGLM